MLTVTQLPSIYVQKDKGLVEVFDHLDVKLLRRDNKNVELQISNPTRYDADVKLYVETSGEARRRLYSLKDASKVKMVNVKGNSSRVVKL